MEERERRRVAATVVQCAARVEARASLALARRTVSAPAWRAAVSAPARVRSLRGGISQWRRRRRRRRGAGSDDEEASIVAAKPWRRRRARRKHRPRGGCGIYARAAAGVDAQPAPSSAVGWRRGQSCGARGWRRRDGGALGALDPARASGALGAPLAAPAAAWRRQDLWLSFPGKTRQADGACSTPTQRAAAAPRLRRPRRSRARLCRRARETRVRRRRAHVPRDRRAQYWASVANAARRRRLRARAGPRGASRDRLSRAVRRARALLLVLCPYPLVIFARRVRGFRSRILDFGPQTLRAAVRRAPRQQRAHGPRVRAASPAAAWPIRRARSRAVGAALRGRGVVHALAARTSLKF